MFVFFSKTSYSRFIHIGISVPKFSNSSGGAITFTSKLSNFKSYLWCIDMIFSTRIGCFGYCIEYEFVINNAQSDSFAVGRLLFRRDTFGWCSSSTTSFGISTTISARLAHALMRDISTDTTDKQHDKLNWKYCNAIKLWMWNRKYIRK